MIRTHPTDSSPRPCNRCICRESRAFRQSNNGFYGHARLTGRLVVPVGAECDTGSRCRSRPYRRRRRM
eukprot:1632206-Prymnesium_polylepis.1